MPLTGTPSGTGMSISCSLSSRAGSGFSLVALDAFSLSRWSPWSRLVSLVALDSLVALVSLARGLLRLLRWFLGAGSFRGGSGSALLRGERAEGQSAGERQAKGELRYGCG